MARQCNLTISVPAQDADEIRAGLEKAVANGSLYIFLDIGDAGDGNEEVAAEGSTDAPAKDTTPVDEDPDLSGVDAPDFD